MSPNASTTRSPVTDHRAVSEVIGFIMLFGLVVAGVSLVQVYGVPAQNERVEFDHNLRVQEDMVRLADGIETAGLTGASVSSTVETGTEYPNRLFFFNPPTPSGVLRTGDALTLTIANASATGEAGDYWDGTNKTFDTRPISYAPNYNVYRSAPTTVVEYGVVYNANPDGQPSVLKRGSLVRGDRISLVTVDGSFNRGSVRAITVDSVPLSAPSATVALSPTRPLVLTLESGLPVAQWRELLAAENVSAGGHVTSVAAGGVPGTVAITLEPHVTYELRLARIGFERGYDEAAAATPAYLTAVGDANRTVPESTTQTVTFEVRDGFDNPVSSQSVTVTADAGRLLGADTLTTDADGRVSFVYAAPAVEGVTTLSARFDAHIDGVAGTTVGNSAAGNASIAFTVTNTDGSGVSGRTGEGGESEWSANDTTETFTQANGKWTNITSIDKVVLSNATMVSREVCNPGDQSCAFVDRLALDFTVNDSTDSYTLSVRVQNADSDEDLGDTLGSISRSTDELRYVKLYKNGDEVFDRTLNETAAEGLVFDGTALDLLSLASYESGGTGDQTDLDEVKIANAQWLTGTMEGRVDVTIEETPV